VVILEAFWAVGWTLAAVIGTFVVGASEDGWRWAFVLGAVPAVYAIIVRWGLPESPRWLESRGRVAESEAIVRGFEAASVPGAAVAQSPAPTDYAAAHPKGVSAIAALWTPALRARTAAIWAVWFCVNFSYYGAFIWIPTILFDQGYDLVRSFEFTLLITLAQLPGYAVAAWLIEVWGRRVTLAVFLIGSAGSAVLFGTADGIWQILLFGSLLSFFNLGAWGALYAVTPELYPTSVRGTGAGWAAGVGRIASIVAPLFTPWALGLGGAGLVFTVFAVFFLIAAICTIPLADKKGESLDATLAGVGREDSGS
jgi:putative MFS transporter